MFVSASPHDATPPHRITSPPAPDAFRRRGRHPKGRNLGAPNSSAYGVSRAEGIGLRIRCTGGYFPRQSLEASDANPIPGLSAGRMSSPRVRTPSMPRRGDLSCPASTDHLARTSPGHLMKPAMMSSVKTCFSKARRSLPESPNDARSWMPSCPHKPRERERERWCDP